MAAGSTDAGASSAETSTPAHDELVCLSTFVAEDLIDELVERSIFVRSQAEDVGEDVGAVKVPASTGKLWMRCLLRSPAALRATDEAKVITFLEVQLAYCPCIPCRSRQQ
jgi:hypothetical protein